MPERGSPDTIKTGCLARFLLAKLKIFFININGSCSNALTGGASDLRHRVAGDLSLAVTAAPPAGPQAGFDLHLLHDLGLYRFDDHRFFLLFALQETDLAARI